MDNNTTEGNMTEEELQKQKLRKKKVRENAKRWREKNPERWKETMSKANKRWIANNPEKWKKIQKDNYDKIMADPDKSFNKQYNHTGNIDDIKRLIPKQLEKHEAKILEEYKKAWWAMKQEHLISYPRLIHAVLVHCVRKYGWKLKTYNGKAPKSVYQHLHHAIKDIDRGIIRRHGHSSDSPRINNYLLLCKILPEYQQTRERYYMKKNAAMEE